MTAYKARISGLLGAAAQTLAFPLSDSPASPQHEHALTFLDLAPDAKEAVLAHLDAADLARCIRVCRGFRDAASSDALWQGLCVRRWQRRDLGAWIGTAGANDDLLGGFRSFRELYPALLQYEELLGVWRQPGKDQIPAIYSFQWGKGCIVGTKLDYSEDRMEPAMSFFQRIDGGASGSSLSYVDSRICVLEMQQRIKRSPSRGAQAAASVAGSLEADSNFGLEFATWMENIVAKPRNRAERRRLSRGSGSGPAGPEKFQLVRISCPVPSRRHPLAGLWKGHVSLVPGIQIVQIAYDFSASQARIVGTQVTNSPMVEAETIIFVLEAAPLAQPLSVHEQRLMEGRHDWDIANLFQDINQLDALIAVGQDEEVVAVNKGQRNYANQEEWELGLINVSGDARLYSYSNGNIGILFHDNEADSMYCELRRIDDDLNSLTRTC